MKPDEEKARAAKGAARFPGVVAIAFWMLLEALIGVFGVLTHHFSSHAARLSVLGVSTLLALAGYAAYRGWAFMESVVEASRRPATVRRNLDEVKERRGPVRSPSRSRARAADPEHEPPERELRLWARSPRPRGSDQAEAIRSR